MPRRDDIHKILVIGSGPIIIGQAAEFDYSGAQACKVLLEEGYEVVLINSNPATIMTDPEFATATYIEPLLADSVTRVIEKERPDALLPTLGGGTALDLARQLTEDGTLERYGVELIGADYDAIRRAEDRELFNADDGGRRPARGALAIAHSLAEAEAAREDIGLPAIVRPGFTMGGQGGGIARTEAEYHERVAEGLAASPINQVLIDESVIGWGEFELELMRDKADNVVVICSIENVDPMGVHTGDSVTVAPQQTLSRHPVPGAARPGHHRDPRRRGRDRRLQRAVRREPRDRRDHRDRDEPARVALVGAGLQGHRVPDRQDRRAAGGGLHAGGDRQRHHPRHARVVRAHDRLRGGQVAPVRVREVPRPGRQAVHLHAVGGRGDGHRPHVQAGVDEGLALARAGRARHAAGGRRGAADRARDPVLGPLRAGVRGLPARPRRGHAERAHRRRPLVPGRAARPGARRGPRGGAGPHVQGGRHVRGRVRGRHALLLLRLGAPRARRPAARGRARRQRRRWSSWARAPTGSGRASSSTTAACTPP